MHQRDFFSTTRGSLRSIQIYLSLAVSSLTEVAILRRFVLIHGIVIIIIEIIIITVIVIIIIIIIIICQN